MSKKMFYAVIAISLLVATPVTGLATIEGPVKTGNFSTANRQEIPLVGDFKEHLSNLANTQLEGARLVELAAQSFADCELRIGRKEIDQARYAECVLEAAQEGRTAYRQLRSSLEKVNSQIRRYKNHLKETSDQNSQALQEEQDRARKDRRQVEKATAMLEDLIAKVQAAEPDAQASLEQKRLQDEISDLCYHEMNMLEIHQQTVDRLVADISLSQNFEEVVNHIQLNVDRWIRQTNYRSVEADEFIRSMRLYGLTRAKVIENEGIVSLFDDNMMEHIASAVNSIPNYAAVMAQLNGKTNIHKPRLPEPQTNGEMLSQLQELLSQIKKGGTDDE